MVATTLIKLSILLQYIRLYPEESQRHPRLTCYVLTGIIFVWGSVFFFTTLFGCHPISDVWALSPGRKCWGLDSSDVGEMYAGFLANSVTNMLFDYIVLCLPVVFYRHLKFEKDQKGKAGLVGLFLVGAWYVSVSKSRLENVYCVLLATFAANILAVWQRSPLYGLTIWSRLRP
jgi:hypothetical protein